MSEAEIQNTTPNAPRGYFVTLAAASAAAGVSGFAFWASQNLKLGEPLWWQGGSLAAALLAAKLTIAATKQQSQMRPQGSLLDAFNAKLDATVAALSRVPESEEGGAIEPTPAQKPQRIESERERLTKAGFSKAEISQILIARETGAAQGMGGGSRRPLRRVEQSRRRHDACAQLPAQPRRRSRAHAQSPRAADSTHGSRPHLGGEVRGDRGAGLCGRSRIYPTESERRTDTGRSMQRPHEGHHRHRADEQDR